MRRSLVFGPIAVLLVLRLAAVAHARDYCLDNDAFVLKGFAVPSKGHCRQVVGYQQLVGVNVLTGGACTAGNGSHVAIQFNLQFDPNSPSDRLYMFEFPLPLPTTQGTLHSYRLFPSPADTGIGTGVGMRVCPKGTAAPL